MAPQPLSDGDFSAAVTAVTSAFGDPSRRSAYLFAREAGQDGVTAAEVALRFDLHPNVARHHLDKLAAGGYLEVFVGRAGGGAGRPSKHYRVSAKAVDLEFPIRRDDLLITLLARALALVPQVQAEAMAEEVGEAYGRTLAAQMGPTAASALGALASTEEQQQSFRGALHAVADALTAHGFQAHAESRGKTIALIRDHCPFGEIAVQHPVICAVDRGMVKGMLAGLVGIDPTGAEESSRALGDDACVTLV